MMLEIVDEGKYIQFLDAGFSDSGKTRVWQISAKGDRTDLLGEIRWFARWRCYAFYAYNAYFEKQCLRDIADFCEKVTKKHKASVGGKGT